ncbi:unnamed protein product [Kuraishia capsulata CBS 1993]|uniref:Uncharacterized protein n=1 Tax=Kuraishia capsulata CBS 1993 TaxID=1382522 RepID=W6MKE3_9ASCO|nr:uncharacterized protein KUCA_T00002800001 [Kuraishia capsulata CBS 1993]CDK26826.1 unnamed protein product [Kuraishia capsulata CBS 1993]
MPYSVQVEVPTECTGNLILNVNSHQTPNSAGTMAQEVTKETSSDSEDWLTTVTRWKRRGDVGLWLWGPLAPAHDATSARKFLTVLQTGFGLIFFKNAFKLWRLKSVRGPKRVVPMLINIAAGGILCYNSFYEYSYSLRRQLAHSYIEASIARRLAEEEGTFVPYWTGPTDFMPSPLSESFKRDAAMMVAAWESQEYWRKQSRHSKTFEHWAIAQGLSPNPWKQLLESKEDTETGVEELLNQGSEVGRSAGSVLNEFLEGARLHVSDGTLDTDSQLETAWDAVDLVQNVRFGQFIRQREMAIFYPVTVIVEE